MKRVLITGSTGFIGYEVACQLASRGLRPRLLVRRPSRAPLVAPLDAEVVQGDLLSEETLRRAVDGVDTIFHLGARATFEPYASLAPTIVDGTDRLMRVAIEAGTVESFVFASSLFVYGEQSTPITRDTAPSPALDYGRAKVDAEARLDALALRSSVRVASLRLPHVYGAQSVLFQQIRSGLAIFPGSMQNRCGHLHVADAARVMIAAAEQRWAGASAVADDFSANWIEYFEVLKLYYPRFRLVRIPRWLGYLGAAIAEPFVRLRGRPSLYTRGTVTGFNLDLPVEPGLPWSELGIRPMYRTIHEGIPAALDGSLLFRWRNPVTDRIG